MWRSPGNTTGYNPQEGLNISPGRPRITTDYLSKNVKKSAKKVKCFHALLDKWVMNPHDATFIAWRKGGKILDRKIQGQIMPGKNKARTREKPSTSTCMSHSLILEMLCGRTSSGMHCSSSTDTRSSNSSNNSDSNNSNFQPLEYMANHPTKVTATSENPPRHFKLFSGLTQIPRTESSLWKAQFGFMQ